MGVHDVRLDPPQEAPQTEKSPQVAQRCDAAGQPDRMHWNSFAACKRFQLLSGRRNGRPFKSGLSHKPRLTLQEGQREWHRSDVQDSRAPWSPLAAQLPVGAIMFTRNPLPAKHHSGHLDRCNLRRRSPPAIGQSRNRRLQDVGNDRGPSLPITPVEGSIARGYKPVMHATEFRGLVNPLTQFDVRQRDLCLRPADESATVTPQDLALSAIGRPDLGIGYARRFPHEIQRHR
jgi:hypothetical protein